MTRMKIKNPKSEIRNTKCGGSAIILAIVLTSLLAIIGVMFLLSSRVESVATSAVSENKDLALAVDTVVANISVAITRDVPGVDPSGEYYDYPDNNNIWLASLEPYQSVSGYFWRQISNIYEYPFTSHDVKAQILPDYNNTFDINTAADADGDGVADSIWVPIPGMTSSKGKSIFAAIRVIDNGGMLNVNTGYIFDPINSIGKSQMDINLITLSLRGVNPSPANVLQAYRCNTELPILYEPNVIWQYDNTAGAYTPFDISDELDLRNRYILAGYNNLIKTRIDALWADAFGIGLEVPVQQGLADPNNWFWRTTNDSLDQRNFDKYDYRHIATTYNYDRIINPSGDKMTNINTASQDKILGAVLAGLSEATTTDVDAIARQITANLIDYVDGDSEVTAIPEPNGTLHFGFEQPCIYISELAQNFFQPDPCNPNVIERSYAVELFKPYLDDIYPQCLTGIDCPWQVVVNTSTGRIEFPVNWTSSSQFYVMVRDDFGVIDVNLADTNGIIDPNTVAQSNILDFNSNNLIELQRRVYDPCSSNYIYVTIDSVLVPVSEVNDPNWLKPQTGLVLRDATHSFQRDIFPNKPFRRLWDWSFGQIDLPTLGSRNNFVGDPAQIQAHPAGSFTNVGFTNIGEFGQLFYRSAYDYGGIGPWEGITEPFMRINLALPEYQQVFKYLTVTDPRVDNIDNDGDGLPGTPLLPDEDELKIKGRININTAPWFVLAQLPWLSQRIGQADDVNLARSIATYRDDVKIPRGFRSIGELMQVGSFDPNLFYYANDGIDLGGYPDLTTPDDILGGAIDDYEERDAIFARISNLVTVRSDVFTAYILVRIGQNGPQKRAIAILDRSGVTPTGGKVKIVAIQMVPDPR